MRGLLSLQAVGRLLDGAALDGEDALVVDRIEDAVDAPPVDHAVAAGAADGGPYDFAPLGVALGDRDVLGVDVNDPVLTASRNS